MDTVTVILLILSMISAEGDRSYAIQEVDNSDVCYEMLMDVIAQSNEDITFGGVCLQVQLPRTALEDA